MSPEESVFSGDFLFITVTMKIQINDDWKQLLTPEFEKEYFGKLKSFVADQYESETVYPPEEQLFSAFNHCSFDDLKVVIIGQDPYHGPNQANGLCFSVNDGIRKPPSLLNIFKERLADVGVEIPESGNLEAWADQGVLLLNAIMSVKASKAGSHKSKGWEKFTDAVIELVNEKKENIVFILWGAYAQKKGKNIDTNKHFIIEGVHPSPLSAYNGFFGSKPFSACNEYLESKGLQKIDW